MQRSFADVGGSRKQRKVTRRKAFLLDMTRMVPWRRLEGLIEPDYSKAGNGRKPYPLGIMLRVYFLQHLECASQVGQNQAAVLTVCRANFRVFTQSVIILHRMAGGN